VGAGTTHSPEEQKFFADTQEYNDESSFDEMLLTIKNVLLPLSFSRFFGEG
jgi:hypothetical protein